MCGRTNVKNFHRARAPARHMQNGRLIAVIVAQRKYSPARIRNLSYRFDVKCGSRHMLLFGMLAKQTANETNKQKKATTTR